MNPLPNINTGSAARFGLAFIAGILATKGVFTADQAASFADTIINAYTSIAAVVTVGTGIWAWWKNRQHKNVAIAASAAGVPVAQVAKVSVTEAQAAAAGAAVKA